MSQPLHPPSPKRLPPGPCPTPHHAPPPPTRKRKERAQAPRPPPFNINEDLKNLLHYYDTNVARGFGNPERYAQFFPHSYDAAEFWSRAYDLPSFTPGPLHPDYTPSCSYAEAASGSGSGSKTKQASKPPSREQVASAAAPLVKKGLPTLPGAQPCFFAPRLSQVPHTDAPAIAATFPDIAARVLRESNCLLPLGFSVLVNARGVISLTVTD